MLQAASPMEWTDYFRLLHPWSALATLVFFFAFLFKKELSILQKLVILPESIMLQESEFGCLKMGYQKLAVKYENHT